MWGRDRAGAGLDGNSAGMGRECRRGKRGGRRVSLWGCCRWNVAWESGEIRVSQAGGTLREVSQGRRRGAGKREGVGEVSPVTGLEWRCRDGQAGPRDRQ